MKKVLVQFKDIEDTQLEIEREEDLKRFLEKYGAEIGVLKDKFYEIDDSSFPVIYLFVVFEKKSISTNDTDELSLSILKLLGRLSKQNPDKSPGFSLGQEGFPLAFYEELADICEDYDIRFNCNVSGEENGYFDVEYELANDGWIVSSKFYEEDN